jgi:phosphopantetheinyl transferase
MPTPDAWAKMGMSAQRRSDMSLNTVLLDTPAGISAKLGWDPGTTVHDRRRIIAKELIAAQLGCEVKDVRIEREAPRGFGYHTRLIASRDGAELPIAIVTASYRAATVVAVCDPGLPVGIDIRDLTPEPADVAQMRKHSHLLDESNVSDLLQHWVRAQAVLEADGRGVRVAPEHVRLDAGRRKGWIPDRKMKYSLVDASRDGWVITIAYGILPTA